MNGSSEINSLNCSKVEHCPSSLVADPMEQTDLLSYFSHNAIQLPKNGSEAQTIEIYQTLRYY